MHLRESEFLSCATQIDLIIVCPVLFLFHLGNYLHGNGRFKYLRRLKGWG